VLPDLPESFAGRAVRHGDADYDALRRVANGNIDGRPALILRPISAADVVDALGYARRTGRPLAVRSGGHSGAGHGTVDDGIVVDVRDLRTIEIDEVDGTAWVGAGLTAGEVCEAA